MFYYNGVRVPLAFIVPKTIGTSKNAVPRRAVALCNDGIRLLAKRLDGRWTSFEASVVESEVFADAIPGTQFIDTGVKFKPLGYSRDGKAILFFRDKFRGWCVSISIRPGQFAIIRDARDFVHVIVLESFQENLVVYPY